MTPKEQQLSERILDIAIASSNPVDISNLVSTYVQLLTFMRYEANRCGRITDYLACGAVGDAVPVTGTGEAGNLSDSINAFVANINGATETASTAKTRKPRGSKPNPSPEQQPAGDKEQPAVTEIHAHSAPVDEEPTPTVSETGKTHDEKLVEAKTAYLNHFKVLADDDAAQRAFRDATTALVSNHGAGRISEVKADRIDDFLTDLTDLISKHQPV